MFTIRNCFIIIIALLVPTGVFAGQPCRCSQQTVVGTYAVTAEGITIMTLGDDTQMPVSVASLTITTINSDGEASSTGYVAVGDQIMPFGIGPEDPVMNSMITVNSDCTGTETLSSGQVAELIVHKGGNEISSIMVQGGQLGAPIVTSKWKRISRIPDINFPFMRRWSKVGGTYVTSQSGVTVIPGVGAAPDAFLGRASISHDGTLEFKGTAMAAGTYMPFTLADGMWEEGKFAFTGSITGGIMAGGVQYMGEVENWVVVLDGGNELWGISIAVPTGNPVALMKAKRVSRQPIILE